MGKLLITTFLTQHTSTESIPVTFETDVVDCEVPMLISLPALENMQAKIDFTNLTLTTPSFDHKLIREGAGHLRLQLENDPVIVDPYTLSKDFVKTSPRKDLSVNHTKTAEHDNVGDTKTATPPKIQNVIPVDQTSQPLSPWTKSKNYIYNSTMH